MVYMRTEGINNSRTQTVRQPCKFTLWYDVFLQAKQCWSGEQWLINPPPDFSGNLLVFSWRGEVHRHTETAINFQDVLSLPEALKKWWRWQIHAGYRSQRNHGHPTSTVQRSSKVEGVWASSQLCVLSPSKATECSVESCLVCCQCHALKLCYSSRAGAFNSSHSSATKYYVLIVLFLIDLCSQCKLG